MSQLTLNFEENDTFKDHVCEPGEIALSDMFEAYYCCRKNKRKTGNALKFELDYENNLIQLWREINAGSYRVGRSIAFIVEKPVKREIFAGDFRDRVIHHLIINKFIHLFEKDFIYDSYSCRKGRGTLFGVKRVDRFIRACSENYTRDCYVLKMDIQGFFMSIRRDILFDKLHELIGCNYHEPDRDLLLSLVYKVVMNDCTQSCIIKSSRRKWEGLPSNKSLFGQQGKMRGLPIGNLTSQIFGNFYLSSFDHFIKSEHGIRYYARYVDDFVIVHPNKTFLRNLIPVIRDFLRNELDLVLHPKKIQLQHYSKGTKFTGAFIMPGRIYIDKRTKNNLYQSVRKWNHRVRQTDTRLEYGKVQHLQSSVNSYLGFMRHYRTYRLRKKILYSMSAKFDRYLHPANDYTKLVNISPVPNKFYEDNNN
ncbi:hypothetical protein D0T84_21680 [Dysgonomonas sp. 521]|uniref:RNA-directed DNA polymerase n=1 Tax=Dysgonomonas sp. 521 TaxID=2302932 RepID=UPI0013D6B16E|nr:reverse transcriptase domain-containing protein [Dysgonomonas sp. 521]NDV97482.1 hypothetical protein [Dysgonomonas sp. 521]